MNVIYVLILAFPSFLPHATCAQETAKNPPQEPKLTDLCQILSKPYVYNNSIVKVRGYMDVSWEYSQLVDKRCGSLWLAFADSSAPPQLIATVSGSGTAGGKDATGKQTPPLSIRLVRDSNWEQLEHYMNQNAKAQNCWQGPAPDLERLSDCTTYRITATFMGRIDAVSKSVYESRLKRKTGHKIDWRGFGQMGMFDAQIVVKSVEEVIAVDELESGSQKNKPEVYDVAEAYEVYSAILPSEWPWSVKKLIIRAETVAYTNCLRVGDAKDKDVDLAIALPQQYLWVNSGSGSRPRL